MLTHVRLRQGLLRTGCNSHSRTSYYPQTYLVSVLPVIIGLYIVVVRGLLWLLRPALRFAVPQLKSHAFFLSHERTNALAMDVSAPLLMPCGGHRYIVPALVDINVL
jgi:hypothetical protein